jgi:hypothetical protein
MPRRRRPDPVVAAAMQAAREAEFLADELRRARDERTSWVVRGDENRAFLVAHNAELVAYWDARVAKRKARVNKKGRARARRRKARLDVRRGCILVARRLPLGFARVLFAYLPAVVPARPLAIPPAAQPEYNAPKESVAERRRRRRRRRKARKKKE